MENITTWSKTKQYEKIRDILIAYPTAKDFKKQFKNCNEEQQMLLSQLPDDASKKEYVDFLQYIFVKHSKLGKFLINAGAGIASGALMAYLGNLGGKKYYDNEKQKADEELRSRARKGTLIGGVSGAVLGGAGGAGLEYNMNRNSPSLQKDATINGGVGGALAGSIYGTNVGSAVGALSGYFNKMRVNKIHKNDPLIGTGVGGLTGLIGGTGVAHAIQSWREKELQKQIEDLKK